MYMYICIYICQRERDPGECRASECLICTYTYICIYIYMYMCVYMYIYPRERETLVSIGRQNVSCVLQNYI